MRKMLFEKPFVNRVEEIEQFRTLITASTSTSDNTAGKPPIFMYSGVTGCGKRFLRLRFQEECREKDKKHGLPIPCVSLSLMRSLQPDDYLKKAEIISLIANQFRQEYKTEFPTLVPALMHMGLKQAQGEAQQMEVLEKLGGLLFPFAGFLAGITVLGAVLTQNVLNIVAAVGPVILSSGVMAIDRVRRHAFQQKLDKLETMDYRDIANLLVTLLLDDLRAGNVRHREGNTIQRVILLDETEVLSEEGASWFWEMAQEIQDQGDTLLVLFGKRKLAPPPGSDAEKPVFKEIKGLAYEDACNYLKQHQQFQFRRMPGRGRARSITASDGKKIKVTEPAVLDTVCEIVLRRVAEDPTGDLNQLRFNPKLVELISGALFAAWKDRGGQYSDDNALVKLPRASGPRDIPFFLKEVFDNHLGLADATRRWVRYLCLSEAFDSAYAIALFKEKETEGGEEQKWATIISLPSIIRHKPGFGTEMWEVAPLLRSLLEETEVLDEQAAQTIYSWSFGYWLNRVADEASPIADGTLRRQQRHYRYELATYWGMAFTSLDHLLRADTDAGAPDALCALSLILLEFHWWWCQNESSDHWQGILQRTRIAIEGSGKNNVMVKSLIDIMDRLDRAFPKGWYLSSTEWEEAKKDYKPEVVEAWSYKEVLKSMQDLRDLAQAWERDGGDPASKRRLARLQGYISNYIGDACIELARESERNGDHEEAERLRDEAKREYLAVERCFETSEQDDILPRAFIQCDLAELYTDMGQMDDVLQKIGATLNSLRSKEEKDGATMECAADTYKNRSRLQERICSASDSGVASDAAQHSGEAMGRSLMYSLRFFCEDKDNYSARYYAYTLRAILRTIQAWQCRSDRLLSCFAAGLCEQIDLTLSGGNTTSLEAKTPPDLQSLLKLPAIPLDGSQQIYEALAKKIGQQYSAAFARLDEELSPKSAEAV